MQGGCGSRRAGSRRISRLWNRPRNWSTTSIEGASSARRNVSREKILDRPRLFDMACRITMDAHPGQHPDADEVQVRAVLEQRLPCVDGWRRADDGRRRRWRSFDALSDLGISYVVVGSISTSRCGIRVRPRMSTDRLGQDSIHRIARQLGPGSPRPRCRSGRSRTIRHEMKVVTRSRSSSSS